MMDPAAPRIPIPSSGAVRLRVRYNECDPMGLAHHASYIEWLELGRTELLRASGLTYRDMEAAGIYLVVTRLEVRYRAPARYDDEVIIETRVSGGGRARIDHEYDAWLADPVGASNGSGRTILLATAATTLACIGADKRPKPLPDWLRAEAHVQSGG